MQPPFSQMEKIRPSRSPRAQTPGPPPLCPVLTKMRPPWAWGRMETRVGAREGRHERTRWAGITGVSEIPLVAPVLCRVGQRVWKGNKRMTHPCVGPRGAWVLGLCTHCLFPLSGSLVFLTVFLSTVAPTARVGHILSPCPALLFFVATEYYVALCYVPVVYLP